MNKDIEVQLHSIYDELMEKPNRIKEIFEDFYGADRVDMQGFLDYDGFLALLSKTPLSGFFFSKSTVLDCTEFINSSKETKDIIRALLDEGALNVPVISDDIIAAYFLPMMSSVIARTWTNGFILVHFPHVRVTNENGRFVDINHLWVKVGLKNNGTSIGYFGINRSEYTISHMKADYLHSHIAGVPFDNFTLFKTPCLGSGPIKNTIATLIVEYDESIWQLFCLELDRYVRIESIAGVPHRYLERINSRELMIGEVSFSMNPASFNYNSLFSIRDMKDFVRYLVERKKLKFNFVNGSFGLAMSYLDYRILVSNEFIRWFNRRFNNRATFTTFPQLMSMRILRRCVIDKGKIWYLVNKSSIHRNYHDYEGTLVCTFKGSPITIHIVDEEPDSNDNSIILICPELAEVIAGAILKVLNYKYGREEEREDTGVGTSTIYL